MIAAQPQNPAPMVIWHGEREVLRIEVDHTILHGQRVDDAGEAHRALVWALTGMTPAWRPIETAPLEPGKQVLGCEDGTMFAMEWDRSFKHWVQLEWIDVNPTHWMPLPPPPK